MELKILSLWYRTLIKRIGLIYTDLFLISLISVICVPSTASIKVQQCDEVEECDANEAKQRNIVRFKKLNH